MSATGVSMPPLSKNNRGSTPHTFVNHNAHINNSNNNNTSATASGTGGVAPSSSHNSSSHRVNAPVSVSRQSTGVPVTTFGTPASNMGFVSASGAVPPRQNKHFALFLKQQQPPLPDMSGVGIAGTRTGEEVLVSETVPLQPPAAPPAAKRNSSVTSVSEDPHQLADLRRRLSQARAETKAANDKWQRRKSEAARATALYELQLEEAAARLRAEREAWVAREQQTRRLAASAAASAGDGGAAAEAEAEALRARVAALQAQLEALKTDHAREVGDLQAQQQRDRAASTAESDERLRALQAEVAALKAELEAVKARAEEERQAAARQLAAAATELATTQAIVRSREQTIADNEHLVAQCRIFIRGICQPDFAVVKGTSLEPVERNRPHPTGYVLVPLTVLLHGYTLLPQKERDSVIETYDKKMADAGINKPQ